MLRDLLETHAPHDEVRRAAELPEGWSPKLWSLLNDEMEVGSLAVPEARGGQGFGVAVLAVVLEEAGRALLPEPLLLSSVLGVRAVLAAPAGAVADDLVRGAVDGSPRRDRRTRGGTGCRSRPAPSTIPARPGPPAASTGCCSAAAADLVVGRASGPEGRESILPRRPASRWRGRSHPARDARPHPSPGSARPRRRAGVPDRRPGRDRRPGHRAGDPAPGRPGRGARRDDRGDARPDPHPSPAATPVRPPAGVVPGDQAPARRRARRPGAGAFGRPLCRGRLRPGPVLGRAARRRSRRPSAPTR